MKLTSLLIGLWLSSINNLNEVIILNNRKKNIITNRRGDAPKKKKSPPPQQQQQQRNTEPIPKPIGKKKKAKKKRKFFKVLIITIVLLVVLGFSVNAFFLKNVNSDLNGNYSKYNISDSAANMAKKHKIANVAIFGIDGREDVEGERTDTVMIASADFEHGKVKVTSLMRDTYVYINEKHNFDKLNAAYAYGGPTLALQTINQNFDTPITDYLIVDFTAVVAMVNAVSGISIDITTEEELYWVNEYINDVNAIVSTDSPHLTTLGQQMVDGSQALAYCRVRYAGDGDFERTLRQRVVFEQVLSKALDLNPQAQYGLLMDTLPYIETSLSTLEMIKYAINLGLMPGKTIEQTRFPTDEFDALDLIDGVSYVIPDTLVDNIKALYWFIYEEAYTPSKEAEKLSTEISDDLNGYSKDEYTYDDEFETNTNRRDSSSDFDE